MELSYAQNLEDYHLSLAFDGMHAGTYIDVGAGHPIADNVSFWFYERGWRGIVIEPQRQLVELYKYLRPRDMVHCGLAGSKVGEADFHIVDRLHGFSTTLEDNARRAKHLAPHTGRSANRSQLLQNYARRMMYTPSSSSRSMSKGLKPMFCSEMIGTASAPKSFLQKRSSPAPENLLGTSGNPTS